jgi:hypothetical protein
LHQDLLGFNESIRPYDHRIALEELEYPAMTIRKKMEPNAHLIIAGVSYTYIMTKKFHSFTYDHRILNSAVSV